MAVTSRATKRKSPRFGHRLLSLVQPPCEGSTESVPWPPRDLVAPGPRSAALALSQQRPSAHALRRGSTPPSAISVGVTSASTPSASAAPLTSRTSRPAGTAPGLSECLVTGLPSLLSRHHVGVAVIGGDRQQRTLARLRVHRRRILRPGPRPRPRPRQPVEEGAGLDGRIPDAGVADHVGVGEVGDDEVVGRPTRSPATIPSADAGAALISGWRS